MSNFFKALAICLLLAGCAYENHPEKMYTDLYDQDWEPQDWLRDGKDPQSIIDGFYTADILTDQDNDGDIPVLEVGDAFMALSGRDKRRIVEFIDHVYGITAQNEKGTIYIEHDRYKGQIGIYTKDGLNML